MLSNDGDALSVSESSILRRQKSRAHINFAWSSKLRWTAVLGQLCTVLIVHFSCGVDLPLAPLLGLIALTAGSNLALGWMFHGGLAPGSFGRFESKGERLMGFASALDVLNLSVLLGLTGGPLNPFATFYFVQLVLGAVILPNRWAIGLTALSLTSYGLLFIWSRELSVFSDPNQLALVQRGMQVAFFAAVVVVVYFVMRVGRELEARERELERDRYLRARDERFDSLITLAAGAAHELATPLSTIAIVAGELERDLNTVQVEAATLEDIKLIRQEVRRCRQILVNMAAQPGELSGESLHRASVVSYLREVIEPLHAESRIALTVGLALESAELEAPQKALRRALRGLVKNALDASALDQSISVVAERRDNHMIMKVIDQGTGMTPDTLAKSGDPFFTTKEPGRGMGLGLFLSRTVIERLGGKLRVESEFGRGTQVSVELPLCLAANPTPKTNDV
ncbi:MAG: ATP-binding protein [Planctomycetota bacterium]